MAFTFSPHPASNRSDASSADWVSNININVSVVCLLHRRVIHVSVSVYHYLHFEQFEYISFSTSTTLSHLQRETNTICALFEN